MGHETHEYEELLTSFGLPALKARRKYVILCTIYTFFHGLYACLEKFKSYILVTL